MINFNEAEHKYTNSSGREYTSVTTLIGQFENEFDSLKEATACAQRGSYIKGYKYEGMSVSEILTLWKKINKDSLIKGNKYHDAKELDVLYSGQKLIKPLNGKYELFKGYQPFIKLYELEAGITYPELRVFIDAIEIAGHVDVVEVTDRYVVNIKDYKTNKNELTKVAYNDKKMKAPLDFLPDTNYFHYCLQLNLYAWMLEYYGYTVGTIEILHKRFDDDLPIPDEFIPPFGYDEVEMRRRKTVKIPYRPDIVKILLQDRWIA